MYISRLSAEVRGQRAELLRDARLLRARRAGRAIAVRFSASHKAKEQSLYEQAMADREALASQRELVAQAG